MPTRDCDIVINCDCAENPFANLSAEQPEPYVFVSPHVILRNPPLGKTFQQLGCKRWCYSAISQADADACAVAQATECATVVVTQPPIIPDPPLPPTGFPRVSVFATEPTTAFGEPPGVFNLFRTGSLAQPLTVQFTLSGEAKNGVDYNTVPYSVTIAAGDDNVDVIVVPMDTGETIAKNAILTVISGSNYAPGAESSDEIEITPFDCGTPSFKVIGWGAALAQQIADLRPNAEDSDLPEWDGIFRLPQASDTYDSNSSCYAIAGKRINLLIQPSRMLQETVSCPSGWIANTPSHPECHSCVFGGTEITFITSDILTINDGADAATILVNGGSGIIGNYRFYLSPVCPDLYLGFLGYQLEGDDKAHFTIDGGLLAVTTL